MTFNVWTFLFEVLNFLVLAFVLHHLLYRPLREAIDKRKADGERARTEAETARQKAEAVQKQLTAKLADTDCERTVVLRQATEQAEAEKTKRLAEAEAMAKEILERARADAERLHEYTLAGLGGQVGEMAVALAERLLHQAADSSLDRQLVRHLTETIRAIPADEGERVRQDTGETKPMVESAKPLHESERIALTAAVRGLLGRECEVTFEVKPELVAGVLVRSGGHVWDATVAAQLASAREAVRGGPDA